MPTINVINKRKSLVTVAGGGAIARLVPGDNAVDADAWKALSSAPGVQELLDPSTGCLEIGTGKPKPLPTKASPTERSKAHGRRADELADFDADQIKGILADTDDEALLETWEAGEDRKEIRGLIRKRLRAVKKAASRN